MTGWWIAGDIGGTKTQLGLFDPAAGRFVATARFENDVYSSVHEPISRFIQQHAATGRVLQAVLAAAGPVQQDATGQRFAWLTNRRWRIDSSLLTGIPVWVTNDFSALAHACGAWLTHPGQAPLQDLCLQLGKQYPISRDQTWAVVGAGTGLGQAFLVPAADGWSVQPSEGGHAAWSPTGKDNQALWTWFCETQGHAPSCEDLISGRGIATLHAFLTSTRAQGDLNAQARDIVARGMAEQDTTHTAALHWFLRLYAGFAVQTLQACHPTGGVFIGGGLAPRMLPWMESIFVQEVERQWKMRRNQSIPPLFVVVDELATLWGAVLEFTHSGEGMQGSSNISSAFSPKVV